MCVLLVAAPDEKTKERPGYVLALCDQYWAHTAWLRTHLFNVDWRTS